MNSNLYPHLHGIAITMSMEEIPKRIFPPPPPIDPHEWRARCEAGGYVLEAIGTTPDMCLQRLDGAVLTAKDKKIIRICRDLEEIFKKEHKEGRGMHSQSIAEYLSRHFRDQSGNNGWNVLAQIFGVDMRDLGTAITQYIGYSKLYSNWDDAYWEKSVAAGFIKIGEVLTGIPPEEWPEFLIAR